MYFPLYSSTLFRVLSGHFKNISIHLTSVSIAGIFQAFIKTAALGRGIRDGAPLPTTTLPIAYQNITNT